MKSMNCIQIVLQRSNVILYNLILEWLHCLPAGYSFTKREKEVLAWLIFIHIRTTQELFGTKKRKLSDAQKATVDEKVFSTESRKWIRNKLHISQSNFLVIKKHLVDSGAVVSNKNSCALNTELVPKIKANNSIIIQTTIKSI